MHEASLALSLLELVQETLERHGLKRALVLHVEVGALAMVDAEALAVAFASAKQNSCCAEAKLHLTHIPAQTTCPYCEASVYIQHRSHTLSAVRNDSFRSDIINGIVTGAKIDVHRS